MSKLDTSTTASSSLFVAHNPARWLRLVLAFVVSASSSRGVRRKQHLGALLSLSKIPFRRFTELARVRLLELRSGRNDLVLSVVGEQLIGLCAVLSCHRFFGLQVTSCGKYVLRTRARARAWALLAAHAFTAFMQRPHSHG